jgi:hypothetical protein
MFFTQPILEQMIGRNLIFSIGKLSRVNRIEKKLQGFQNIRQYSTQEPLPEIANDSGPFGEESFLSGQFEGIGAASFGPQVNEKLSVPIDANDVEVKPDGIMYYPEIKYRKRLNEAFGAGGWGLVPTGPHTVKNKKISVCIVFSF